MLDNIGERIKYARELKGLTQSELADRCGYPNKTSISRIEHSGDGVTTKQIRRIAPVLDVSISYLMGYTDVYDNLIACVEKMNAEQYNALLRYAEFLTSQTPPDSAKSDGVRG